MNESREETAPSAEDSPLKGALLEAFFVVLGVVLAFTANEWRSARHDAAQAELALQGIVEEIESNRAAVADSSAYHGRLMGTLRKFEAERPDEVPPIQVFDKGFVSPAIPLSTAWDAATATNAVTHLDYDDVLLLSRIYSDQERYSQQGQMVGEVIYSRLFDEGREGIQRNYRNLHGIIGTFYYRENQLLKVYDKALEALGRVVPDPEPQEDPADATDPR